MVNTPCLHRKLPSLAPPSPQMSSDGFEFTKAAYSDYIKSFFCIKNSQHQLNNQPGQTAESQANSFSSRSLLWNQSLCSTTLDTPSTCTTTVVLTTCTIFVSSRPTMI